jgi:hypothetical protein
LLYTIDPKELTEELPEVSTYGEADMPSGEWKNYSIIAYSVLVRIAKEFGWLNELLPDFLKLFDRLEEDFKETVLSFNKRNLH